MKRLISPEINRLTTGDRPHGLASLEVNLVVLLAAIVLIALCVPLFTLGALALVAHTVFPLWWNWPLFEAQDVRPARPGRALGDVVAALALGNWGYIALLVFIGVASEVGSAWEEERRARLYEETGYEIGIHAQTDDTDQDDELDGGIDEEGLFDEDADATQNRDEDWALDVGFPTYFSMPELAQLLGIPIALATLLYGAWIVAAVHEHTSRASQLARDAATGVRHPPLAAADVDAGPSIWWVGHAQTRPAPTPAPTFDVGVFFLDERPDQPPDARSESEWIRWDDEQQDPPTGYSIP